MSRAVRDVAICREALARLPELALSELRQQWRTLYKFDASPHLSRELLLLAVAYRMQEIAFGGLRSRFIVRVDSEFAPDSPLEEGGFEPSVPLLRKALLGILNRDVRVSGSTSR
jgi:hypothetical protein